MGLGDLSPGRASVVCRPRASHADACSTPSLPHCSRPLAIALPCSQSPAATGRTEGIIDPPETLPLTHPHLSVLHGAWDRGFVSAGDMTNIRIDLTMSLRDRAPTLEGQEMPQSVHQEWTDQR